LIGSDVPEVFWTLDQRRGDKRQPYAVKTILGWTVIGPTGRRNDNRPFTANFIHCDFNLEESGERNEHPILDDNRKMAETRQRSLRTKLDKNSDNGTNFTSANKELKESLKALEQTKIHDRTRRLEIKWHFNPPSASHMGGVWERMIRTTRRILQMLLTEQVVGDECLLTLMAEVEKIMNDRPLTSPSSDATDFEPLTPNDLLLLRANTSIPPGVYDKYSTYSRRWYHQAQYLAGIFWKRWVHEYLPTLQKRHKWHQERRNLEPNDLVLMAEERLPRGQWPLARVIETYPDKNGHVRSVKIRTSDSVRTRPIDKLCFLENQLGLEAPVRDVENEPLIVVRQKVNDQPRNVSGHEE
jgi:hypothetical protein